MRKITVALIVTAAAALFASGAMADQVTGLTTFTSGTPAIAASVNANFAEIQDSVNDNDTRITALEEVRRSFWLPVSANNWVEFPDGSSSSYTWRFAAPSDYVSSGTNDTEISAVFSGGDNCDFRYQFSTSGDSFGITSILVLAPATFTTSVSALNIFQMYISNPTINRTGFSDVTSIKFSRIGADAGDTCTGSLYLYGVKVEYPAGQ